MGHGIKQDLICRHDNAGVEEHCVPHACRPRLDIVGACDQLGLDSRGLAPDSLELLVGQGNSRGEKPGDLSSKACQSGMAGCILKA